MVDKNDSHSNPLTGVDERSSRALGIDGLSVATQGTTIVTNVSLSVRPGSIHCLVGDSGSGKTMTSLAAIGLLPRSMEASGRIELANVERNLLDLSEHEWTKLRGSTIGYIGQNALGCLHPAYTVGFQISEALRRHQTMSRSEARKRVLDELAAVDFDDPVTVADSRPAELSGGMCQRAALAIALCNHPDVLIADEPTTALDEQTQQHVLDLIASRAADTDLSVLLITHDQDVVGAVADDVTTIIDGTTSPGRTPATPQQHDRSNAPQASTEPAVLEIDSISKSFAARTRRRSEHAEVLRGVSLEAGASQTIGLVGRSGAGKTTLARIVAGISKPTEGSVRIAGRPITGPDAVDRIEKASLVQYVFQDPFGSLNPRRSVVAQVGEPLRVAGQTQHEAQDNAQTFLSNVGLTAEQMARLPNELSGGQCQRVGLARALIRRPRVVVLDEPVSALDWSIRNDILAILDDLQSELDVTYLLISHERRLVAQQCDEIYEISDCTVAKI